MGFDPKSVFYMAVPIGNADGTIDEPDADGVHSSLSENDAITAASDDVEGTGGVTVIYRCVPIKKVSAYRVRVEPIPSGEVTEDASNT